MACPVGMWIGLPPGSRLPYITVKATSLEAVEGGNRRQPRRDARAETNWSLSCFEQSMRCLVVADLHYALPQFDWLVAASSHFDLVIFAGDALDLGSIVDFRAQIVVVKKYLALLAAKTRVIICSGNH